MSSTKSKTKLMAKASDEDEFEINHFEDEDYQNDRLDELYFKLMSRMQDKYSHKIYDPEVSRQLMKNCGYYNHDIDWVEQDVTLFSGVANPFHHVKIKPHENVLDLGCGVGVDTLIAAQYTDGLVYGIDPCENEVLLAREIALEKGLDPTKVKFCQSGIRDGLSALKEKKFEVIISNGSVCLFDDKKEVFDLLYDHLAPNG